VSRDAARQILQERRVAPSILSADFARLGAHIAETLSAGARVIHFDVMDGHFVPPITIGPLVAKAISPAIHEAGAILDVHLMIERPQDHVAEFAAAGADIITVHQEATPHLNYALAHIRDHDCLAGCAVTPSTPPEALAELGDLLDVALCMTVNPGWGGQPFIESSIDKIRRLRAVVGPDVAIEVDGGIDTDTAGPCAEAGATLFVAGSAVFGAPDPGAAYAAIAKAAQAA
jgi:ribulose-phosphate 3-epimerase